MIAPDRRHSSNDRIGLHRNLDPGLGERTPADDPCRPGESAIHVLCRGARVVRAEPHCLSEGVSLTVSGFVFGRVSEHKVPRLHVSPPDAKTVLAAASVQFQYSIHLS